MLFMVPPDDSISFVHIPSCCHDPHICPLQASLVVSWLFFGLCPNPKFNAPPGDGVLHCTIYRVALRKVYPSQGDYLCSWVFGCQFFSFCLASKALLFSYWLSAYRTTSLAFDSHYILSCHDL